MLTMRIILSVALLIAWVGMHSQVTAQGHDQQGTEGKQSAKSKKRISEPKPIVVKILPSPKSEADAKKEEEERSERSRAEKLKQQTDDDLVKFTGQLAGYTWLLVIVGILQFAIFIVQIVLVFRQEKATKTIERAYVKLSHFESGISISLTGLVSGAFKLKNFGQTPARITDVVLGHRLLPPNESLPVVPDYTDLDRKPMKAFLVRDEDLSFARFFRLESINDDLENGNKKLWLIGYVDYIDKFGERHRAGYASYYVPGSTRDNLSFLAQEGYFYDRPRKKGEGNDWG